MGFGTSLEPYSFLFESPKSEARTWQLCIS
jgi:hypothetical protein